MELMGKSQEDEDKKTKKLMVRMAIAIVILFIISIILYITISYLKGQLFKFKVNDKSQSLTSSDLFLYEGEKIYVSIKDIAPLIDYKFYKGGYKEYNEDSNKCYLESKDEIVTFEEDSNTIYKTPVKELDYQYFTLSEDVKTRNDKLYILSDDLQLACNLSFFYSEENNTINIYTLSAFVDNYTTNYEYSALKNFNNQKALMYDFLVVQDVENNEQNYNAQNVHYGVSKISTVGNEIKLTELIGTKYSSIEFIESTQEFIVKTTEGKVGIITAEGETKVQPKYDSLKQIDKDLNLYLTTVNGKYGVIEKYGKTLLYEQYDQIGIDASLYPTNNIKNPYLLYNYTIPVMKNGKWGLFSVKGGEEPILPLEYDGIGCSADSNTTNSIVIIPKIKGIILYKNYKPVTNNGYENKIPIYTIVNYLGREIVPWSLSKVYASINNARIDYNMIEYGSEEVLDVIEWIGQNRDLKSLNDESVNIEKTNTTNNTNNNNKTNTITNEITNEVTNTTTTTTNTITNEITENTNSNVITNTVKNTQI